VISQGVIFYACIFLLAITTPLVITAVVLIIAVIPASTGPLMGLATILLILAIPATVAIIGVRDQWWTRQPEGQQGN
jgi:hypothetical protein